MRTLAVLFLTLCLLFSLATVASADIFRITPEMSGTKLESGAYSESGNVYYLSGDLNFILVRTGVDLGYGEIEDTEYQMSGVRIGTELPLLIFKLIAYAGYQTYEFDGPVFGSKEAKGTVVGAGLEYEFNNFFSLRGVVQVPLDMEADWSDDFDFSSAKVDLIFTTLPLVDIFAGYRVLKFESDVDDIDLSGYNVGIRIGI